MKSRYRANFERMSQLHSELDGIFNFHYQAKLFEHEARDVTRALLTAAGIIGDKTTAEVKSTYYKLCNQNSVVARHMRHSDFENNKVTTFSSIAEALLATIILISHKSTGQIEEAYKKFMDIGDANSEKYYTNALRALLAAAMILDNKERSEVMEIYSVSAAPKTTNFTGAPLHYYSSVQGGINTLTVATSGGTPENQFKLAKWLLIRIPASLILSIFLN